MPTGTLNLDRAKGLALKPHGWKTPQHTNLNILHDIKQQKSLTPDLTAYNTEQIYHKICEWFASWQPWQQRVLLCGITNRCSSSQLESLATTLEPVFHRDFITSLRKRYPSAPFKELKKRLAAKAKAKALKSFEENIRPRSTLSIRSDGPLKKKDIRETEGVDNNQNTRDRSFSLPNTYIRAVDVIKPEISSQHFMIPDLHDEASCTGYHIDPLSEFATRFSSEILKAAIQKVSKSSAEYIQSESKIINLLLNLEEDSQTQAVDVFGNLRNIQASDPQCPEVEIKVKFSQGSNSKRKSKQNFQDQIAEENEKETELDEKQAETDELKLELLEQASQVSKLNLARAKTKAKVAPIISTPLVNKSLPHPLVRHHTIINKKVELLKSYPSNSSASSFAESHRHYSGRQDSYKHREFFNKASPKTLGPVQAELRTGDVNRPLGMKDIFVPMQRLYKHNKWWNTPPTPGKTFVRPNVNDLTWQFKQQIEKIWDWVHQWADHEKQNILVQVVKLCDANQISYLARCLADRLQEKMDISWLPDHILLKIFSLLSVEDIDSCTKVCKRWKYLAATDDLWIIKCHQYGLQQGLPDITRLIKMSRKSKLSIDWRTAYEELRYITEEAKTTVPIPQPQSDDSEDSESQVEDDMKNLKEEIIQGIQAQDSEETKNSPLLGKLKFGLLAKSFHGLLSLRKQQSSPDEDTAISVHTSVYEHDSNADFEKLRSDLLATLPMRTAMEETSSEQEPDGVQAENKSVSQLTTDFSKFGRSTIESRMERNRRMRKKKGEDEEEVAMDIRPVLYQARDLRTINDNMSSNPNPTIIIPNREGRLKLEKRQAFVKSIKRVRKLQAHMDSVLCIETDRRRLISGSMDRTIRIWDIRSGRSVHKLYGHKGGVNCLQFNNEMLVSGSWDTSVQVWDLIHFMRKAVLTGHSGSISAVRIGDDCVLSSSHDGSVRVWCLLTNQCLSVLRIHKLHILSMAFDGRYVLTGASDNLMKLTDLSSGKCVKLFHGHAAAIDRIVWSGNLILTANNRGQVYFWRLDTGSLETVIQAHDAPILSITLHHGHFYTTSRDTTIKEWDLQTLSCLRILQGHKGPVTAFKVTEKHMVSCSTDGLIRVWDMTMPVKRNGETEVETIPLQIINRQLSNLNDRTSTTTTKVTQNPAN